MTTIAVIDTETTGMDPAVDRVIEAACVRVDCEPPIAAITNWAQWRYTPGERGVPPESSAVHHLTAEDLIGRPLFTRAEWHHNVTPNADYLVAHNVAFDRGFVNADHLTIGSTIGDEQRPWICTLKCARVAWPEAPGHGNQVLRYWLGLKPELPAGTHPHQAAYDALVTAEILLRLLAHFDYNLVRMMQITQQPSLLRLISFGKHRGMAWKDAPRDYLQWILKQDFGEDEKHTANYWLSKGAEAPRGATP